jgi:PAS domain S-box-containing protein
VELIVQALQRAIAKRSQGQTSAPQEQRELLSVKEYPEILIRKLEEKHLELRQRTEQLQQSEERNRLLAWLVESSEEAIIAKSLDGDILSWNAGAEKLYGYTAPEAIGRSVRIIVPPERLEEWQELNDQVKRGEHVEDLETMRLRKSGSQVQVALRVSPVRGERGAVVAISAIARDITRQKRLEAELTRREQQLESFFMASTAGMAILDSELCFFKLNETLAAINGVPLQQHLGRSVAEILPQLGPVLEPTLRKVLMTGEPILNHEISGETAANPGIIRHWVASYFPIRIGANRAEGLGAVVVEISERKRAEERLERSQRNLRALAAHLQTVREEERTRISREVHDQLGQMLTGLKMDLRWLQRRLEQPEPQWDGAALRQKLGEGQTLVDDTIGIVQRIAAELRPSDLDSLGLLPAMRSEAHRFEERTRIRVSLALPEELVTPQREIATALFRIFQETLTNVARHAQASAVEVKLQETGGEVCLEIHDNGQGIAPEVLSRPTSLGLLGMNERAYSLGGQFDIEGLPGGGTKVSVRIPLPATNKT